MVLALWIYKLIVSSVAISLLFVIVKFILGLIIRIINKRTPNTNMVIDITITDPVVIAKIENLEEQLEITNQQIQQQQDRLDILQQARITTYNRPEANDLDGKILKTQENILKLSAKSDRIGFMINEIGIMYYNGTRT